MRYLIFARLKLEENGQHIIYFLFKIFVNIVLFIDCHQNFCTYLKTVLLWRKPKPYVNLIMWNQLTSRNINICFFFLPFLAPFVSSHYITLRTLKRQLEITMNILFFFFFERSRGQTNPLHSINDNRTTSLLHELPLLRGTTQIFFFLCYEKLHITWTIYITTLRNG